MDSFDLRNNNDKRHFMRVETDTPIDVVYEGRTLRGACKDLSATGLQVEMPITVVLGAQVTICIMPNDEAGKLPPFRALATITRLVTNEQSSTTYGLVIDEILE